MKSVVPSETAMKTPNGARKRSRSQMAPGARSRRQSRLEVTRYSRASAGLHLRPFAVPELQLGSCGHDLAQTVDRLVQRQAQERQLRHELLVLGDAGRRHLRVAEVVDVRFRILRGLHP